MEDKHILSEQENAPGIYSVVSANTRSDINFKDKQDKRYDIAVM